MATLLGRANYLTFKQDVYMVMFVAFNGATATILAKNLDREQALELVNEINDSLYHTIKGEKLEEDIND